jgi:hypothetical protein
MKKNAITVYPAVITKHTDATPNIQREHLLYPIPAKEFENNPKLTPKDQNEGY